MTRLIHCTKLNKEAEGLDQPPLPGDLGQKIYACISKEAWQQWIQHQTMLLNENRLSMIDPKARAFLMQEMEKFLFGTGSEKPPGFVPEKPTSST
jgi:Fe-S cluster biosynthesis and repair protein YggX